MRVLMQVDLSNGLKIVPTGGPAVAVGATDIKACNAIVDILNGVLFPQSLDAQLRQFAGVNAKVTAASLSCRPADMVIWCGQPLAAFCTALLLS